jgi:hypothetical protein
MGTCGDCHTGKLHVACGEKCKRELICSHVSLFNKERLFLNIIFRFVKNLVQLIVHHV